MLTFRQFGYGYIFYKEVEKVRQQILNINTAVISPETVIPLKDDVSVSNRAAIVTSPPDLSCFMVPIKLATRNRTRYFGVVMPGFDDKLEQLYERWQNSRNILKISSIELNPIRHDPRLLTDPINSATPLEIWDAMLGKSHRVMTWSTRAGGRGQV